MAKEIFSRYELKYLIPFQTYKALVEEMAPYMRFDRFGEEGKYNIVSLYFDSPDQKIYYETRNKLKFRQKLRLRIYDGAGLEDAAFFEVKQKYNNVVNKRRTLIILKDAYNYLNGTEIEKLNISNTQIMGEVNNFKERYDLHPEVVVSYDRQAFHGIQDEDLRVTFDYNLMCRRDDLHIENGPQGKLFVDQDMVILEVKVTHSVPLWLSRLLAKYECPKKSVSKFCTSIDVSKQQKEPSFV